MRHAHEGQHTRAIEPVRYAGIEDLVRFLFPNHTAIRIEHLNAMYLEPLRGVGIEPVPQHQFFNRHFCAEIHFPPRIIFLRGVRHGFICKNAIRVAVVAIRRRTRKRRTALRGFSLWRDVIAIAENLDFGEMQIYSIAHIRDTHEAAIEIFFAFRPQLQRKSFLELAHAGDLKARNFLSQRVC